MVIDPTDISLLRCRSLKLKESTHRHMLSGLTRIKLDTSTTMSDKGYLTSIRLMTPLKSKFLLAYICVECAHERELLIRKLIDRKRRRQSTYQCSTDTATSLFKFI